MTTYLRIRWSHEANDDPIVLYHEIEANGRETRRIELFEDGRLQGADTRDPDAATSLSLEPLPTIDAIREQSDFSVVEIDREEFDAVWRRAVTGG